MAWLLTSGFQLINPNCPIVRCRVCFGVGKVSAQHTGPLLTQHLTSPCPACAGFGYDTKSCQLLKVEQKVVSVNLPPGCRPGFHVVLKGEGHEVVENLSKVVGDLEVTIDSVKSGNFKLLQNSVELTIVMSVEEALRGFVYEEPYVEGRTLRIDRMDKLTIPDSKITLKELGLQSVEQLSDESDGSKKKRDDLVVIFELESETAEKSLEDNDEDEAQLFNENGEPNLISSQEELNAYLEKKKAAANIKVGRNFLKLLSKLYKFKA